MILVVYIILVLVRDIKINTEVIRLEYKIINVKNTTYRLGKIKNNNTYYYRSFGKQTISGVVFHREKKGNRIRNIYGYYIYEMAK